MNSRTAPATIYVFLIVSDFSKEIAMKTGNITSKYLGSPEKVPLSTGIKKAKLANIK